MSLQMAKPSMRMVCVVSVVILGFTSRGTLHAADKVDICHFQSGKGSWKLLSVGQPAANAHLENHDDAIPGGTTSQTSTRLNADCEKVKAQCLCDYSAQNLAALGFTEGANGCIVTNLGVVFGTTCLFGPSGPGGCSAPLINVQSRIFNPPVFAVCSIIAPPDEPQLDRELTEEEFTACRNDVIQAAQARGVTCIQR